MSAPEADARIIEAHERGQPSDTGAGVVAVGHIKDASVDELISSITKAEQPEHVEPVLGDGTVARDAYLQQDRALVQGVTDWQRKFRGMQARKEVLDYSEQALVQGVTDWQRKFRGMQARKDVLDSERDLAQGVTDLQRRFRGMQARMRVFDSEKNLPRVSLHNA